MILIGCVYTKGMKFHLALHALLITHKLTSYRLGELSGISRSNLSKLRG